ncbi:MAG: TolC family protein [Bdellovibrionaceae bacterium]|nr:TolC family protein [Pseudobdellovibrionaceae bacterium]
MEAVKELLFAYKEKKYVAGKSPQGDSMKAHFELTQLELEVLTLHQQEEALQENLKALVNDMEFENLELSHLLLSTPKFNNNHITDSLPQLQAFLQNQSPNIKFQAQALKEAEYKSSLAKWAYAPDFQLQYQQSISGEPSDSNIYSIAMSIPLWFWKEKAEASAANSKMLAQEYRLKDTLQKSIAKVKELKGKVETGIKTLNIYETSLIPQAQSAYNSTRSSYTANKTSFLDLLDSERSLYRVRIGFYQALKQYVNQLSQLESELGFSVSNLEIKNKETK